MSVLLAQSPGTPTGPEFGKASPLGLVTVRSPNPDQMKHNHQVLAYAYDEGDDGSTTIRIYDPNRPDDDGARLVIGPGTRVEYPDGMTVRGFFRTEYDPADPPVA